MDHDSKDTETPAAGGPANPASSAEPSADLWAVSYSEEEDRELTLAEVQSALERGEINGATIVWRPGMDDWAPLSETPDLAPLIAQIPAEPPAPTAAEPVAAEGPPPTGPEPASVPPSAPPAPSAPSDPIFDELDQRFTPGRGRYIAAGAALLAALGAVLWWVESSSDDAVSQQPLPVATARASASPPPTPSLLPHQTPAGDMPSENDAEALHPRGHLQPFNRIAALRVMGKAAQKAIRCRGRGAPKGVARLAVTFEPSGKMSSARIFQAPYAGTPTATCIVSKIGKPEISPFTGAAVTIRVPVELY